VIPDTLQKLAVPIDGLVPYVRNPRQGDVGAIVTSLERHGQYRPIVVNVGRLTGRPNEVLAGNADAAPATAAPRPGAGIPWAPFVPPIVPAAPRP
jgi:hypothetical protein